MAQLQNKKVFVTGAAGFIGSHLVELLLQEGAQVRALYHYNSENRIANLDFLGEHPHLEKVAGDVRNAHHMLELSKGMDFIFHLAALIAIPYSMEAPGDYISTNVQGTLNILEAARINGVAKTIVTSTSEVYGSPEVLPIVETHPLQTQSPYAASKAGADHLAYSYYCAYDLPVMILRPFNTFGPRQSMRAILPSVILQLLRGPKVEVGNLEPIRDLTYVKDTAAGFLAAALTKNVDGKTVQLGTNKGYSVREMIETVGECLNIKPVIVTQEARKRKTRFEVERLVSSPQLAKKLLGWEPKTSFKEGLQLTIDFFRQNDARVDPTHYVK